MARVQEKQITVRISDEADRWLRRMAGRRTKATVIRELIEREMKRDREDELLDAFNRAARDLTSGDRDERERLPAAFSGRGI